MKEKEIVLKEVEIKANRKKPSLDSRNMSYQTDRSLNMKDSENFGGTILDYLRFNNYDFQDVDGEIRFLSLTRNFGRNTTPVIMIDGQQQQDANILRYST